MTSQKAADSELRDSRHPEPTTLTPLAIALLAVAKELAKLGVEIPSPVLDTSPTASETGGTLPPKTTGDQAAAAAKGPDASNPAATPAPDGAAAAAEATTTQDALAGCFGSMSLASSGSSSLHWYTVTVGRKPGVYQGWHLVQTLVSGVSGACYQKFSVRENAYAAFGEAAAKGLVVARS